ncbi:MAG: DUF805 domain-containing protein [Maricaulaceae bacterium]|nr:DUF805 domain-containing protein [Maricaulaceae bacterium]
MNIGKVLFSPNGRIGQQEFWIGWVILVAANVLLTWIPLLGFLIMLALIYVGICVYGKRLHDSGRSAWMHAIPWALGIVLLVVGFTVAGGAMLPAILEGGEPDPAAIFAAGGSMMIFWLLSFVIWIAYTLWVGLAKGDAGDNRFGPPPGAAAAPPASPPPAA